MMAQQHDYLSYLLRLWQTSDADHSVWRVMLEDPQTGEKRGFASLEAAFAFLDDAVQHGQDGQDGQDIHMAEG